MMGNTIASELDRSYIAGFFDGEGCVNFGRRGSWTFMVTVGNTRRDILEWIQTFYGGHIEKVGARHPRQKDFFILHFHGLRADRFLSDIYPYVRLKKHQVEVGMEIRSLFLPGFNRWLKVPQANIQRRYELMAELKALNRKGPGAL